MYNKSLYIDLDVFVDIPLLKQILPFFNKIYINDKVVHDILIRLLLFDYKYYSNQRWKYTNLYYEENKQRLFHALDFNIKILYLLDIKKVSDDIVFSIKYSLLIKLHPQLIHLTLSKLYLYIDKMLLNATYSILAFNINIKNKKDIKETLIKILLIENDPNITLQ